MAGKSRSVRRATAARISEATRNRRKPAEKGPMSWARIRPAMKVPPQNMVARISLQ
jgi:hypothetical protein